ncbi:MAG: hypothetical protein QFX35_02165 [Candidatus Verstraetearchaeota archaeon]|nr:hypothetical protein [Candidatus Verstraetearchaeota archaeon]
MGNIEKKGKKLVYISEDLVNEVSEISRSKGESITKYIENLVAQAIRVDRLGTLPEGIADILEMIHVQRVLGGTFVPSGVMNSLCDSFNNDGFASRWYESGRLYGRYLKEKFKDPVRALQLMLRVMRWDLNEVEARRDGEHVVIRCVSTSLPQEGAEWLLRFIEGAMHGIGYKTVNEECMKGMVICSFAPER